MSKHLPAFSSNGVAQGLVVAPTQRLKILALTNQSLTSYLIQFFNLCFDHVFSHVYLLKIVDWNHVHFLGKSI